MTMFWMLPPDIAAETEKHWRKNREKIALGHKEDDHEQGQQMM